MDDIQHMEIEIRADGRVARLALARGIPADREGIEEDLRSLPESHTIMLAEIRPLLVGVPAEHDAAQFELDVHGYGL